MIHHEEFPYCHHHLLQAINQTMLSNRRSYADLYGKLMMADIEREKKLHTEWTKRVEKWKTLHMNVNIEQFQ